MKAGKKISSGAQQRGIQHAASLVARQRRVGSGLTDGSVKAPGSMNKKKTGAC